MRSITSKLSFGKRELAFYSLGLGLLIQFPLAYIAILYSRSVNDLSASEFPFSKVFNPELGSAFVISSIQATIFIFLFWLFVRWVASTAEKAGRSYVAFMILGLLVPAIAWIIVILFKKPEQAPKNHTEI